MMYKIPLVWQMYGHVWVEAENSEKAIEHALGPDCPLPDDGEYVDGSIAVDDCVSIVTLFRNHTKKRVMCTKHGWATIDARTDAEALEIAKNMKDSEYDWGDAYYHEVVEDVLDDE